MNRGVVTLTDSEIELGLQLAQTASFAPLLIQKLTAASQEATNPTVVELSEDQVEQIIDNLPAPQESTPVMRELRAKLTQFLASLRAGKIEAGTQPG
jgi:hypothetical protein